MGTVNLQLIHWNTSDAEEKARLLENIGFLVHYDLPPLPELIQRVSQNPPDALVIDLSRLPSHGRDLGVALRQVKGTRHIPLIFVGGEQLKVDRIRVLLPDATYTDWQAIASALDQALTSQPAVPVVPIPRFAAYAGTPLPKKLGIKTGSRVGLVQAPPEFEESLGELPAGVTLQDGLANPCDLAIWFVRSLDELKQNMEQMTDAAGDIPLWIAWEKKSSRLVGQSESGVTQTVVRKAGLAANWVDYKICAIDEQWSGLLFRRRKPG